MPLTTTVVSQALKRAKDSPSVPLHLRFLLKYLQKDPYPVRELPPAHERELQKAIEDPSIGYLPSFVSPNGIPLAREQQFWMPGDTREALGYKPSLRPGVVSSLYEQNPDSWRSVLGGSEALQLARSLGSFTATPDTTRRVWKVRDRYTFDAVDKAQRTVSGEEAPSQAYLLTQTPTFFLPRVLGGLGRPFDVRTEVPMSNTALTRLRQFAKTGAWLR